MLSQKTIDIVKSTAPVLAERGTEITTYFYKAMFEAHPELLNIFNSVNQKKGRQQTALANTVYAAATHIDQLEVLLPAVKQIAHKHRSLNVKKEHYPIVGEFLLKAIKDVLGDAATPEIIEAWGEAYGVIAQVFIDVEEEMYETTKEVAWEGFKNFKIVKKEKESAIITSFYLEAQDGTSIPYYQPGQYVTVRLNMTGETYLLNRQYSLSDAPGKDYLRISVKRESGEDLVEEGIVSNFLHDQLNIGDTIELTAPAGDFVLDSNNENPVYLISGGVGITPMVSMLNDIAEKQPKRPVTFIHAAKSANVHAFKQEVGETLNKLLNGRQYFYYDQVDTDLEETIFEGRIDLNKFKNEIAHKENSFYICGPAPFMKNMIDQLESLGVSEEAIRYEFFGPSINLKETQNS
ncbi:nitric oxide dioxygenase [Metabacillus crassostreae]|uniref:NO-inducible flavohemoprotein n=1 Tax=Metabacillus crassostreae TaxID=929098 RepID=UPI00195BFE4A|nr:NO-inducible flavohemoprotein [Metabacillus crassostreae]MBM7604305.1 nitric oxide dioxygenase [Metabacillus crassostreae]